MNKPQLKHKRTKFTFTPSQMLDQLAVLHLRALLQHESVWLATTREAADALEHCCIGNVDGGPATAKEIADKLNSVPQDYVPVRISLEEAFFLTFVLQSIEVVEEGQTGLLPLPPEVLWSRFKEIKPSFPISYLGYHHFRSKGWVPRSGLLYGVDLVLYQRHPAASHSDYGVLLVPLQGPFKLDLSWNDMQIAQRLCNQVSKDLMLVYVSELPGVDYGSPQCLGQLEVQERIMTRWVPDAARD